MGPPHVAIIENRAMIKGLAEGPVEKDPTRPGFARVRFRVTGAETLENWPNLFERDIGQSIDLYVPEEMIGSFAPGAEIKVVARKTGLGTAFVQR